MAAAPPPNLFLTVGSPYDAAVQLIYKLPGQYRLIRHTHHAHIVDGTNLSYQYLISPSLGTSSITLRAPADRSYEMELLQTTTVNLRTRTGPSATKIEKRAFRIANGRWSLWSVVEGVGDVVGVKLVDLVIGEVRAPVRVETSEADEVQKVGLNGGAWKDGLGMNAVAVCVWVGRQVCWQGMHRVERVGGGVSECSDEFWPVGEGGR